VSKKKGDEKLAYPEINKLVSYLLTLPHSSACVERIFSAINLNKTKTRNRLGTETLSGILHIKRLINENGKNCFNFHVASNAPSVRKVPGLIFFPPYKWRRSLDN